MENKLLHIDASFKSAENDDGSIKITGYASTNDKDRAGDVIAADAWSKGGLVDYKKNPIILFNHNYNEPVGQATAVSVTDKGLSLEATVSSAAGKVLQLVKDGVLRAFSVGFMIKDADYDSKTDIFVIKEAELYEVSIVSVPCNQDATFSLAKAFDTEEAFNDYKKNFIKEEPKTKNPAELAAEDLAKAQDSAGKQATEPNKEENKMDPKELQAMLEKVAKETADAVTKAQKDAADADAAAKAKELEDGKAFDLKVASSAEKLMEDITKRFEEKNESLETIIGELKEDLVAKSDEIAAMRDNKRVFDNRGTSASDWKKQYGEDATDSYILGIVTGKGDQTKFAKDLVEKVNTDSGVEVSSADFEQIVSTNIQRDIENELVLAPMFREIAMNSATMILPVMPDAGYAEFVAATTTAATAPKGNLDERGVAYGTNAGMALGEKIISTKKIMSLSYLGNETEEDAILPIIGLIRDAMTRSHARTIENAVLVGNHADGAFGVGGDSFDGLVTLADANAQQTAISTAFASNVVTAADLMGIRRSMGKYGLRPEDVVYIVSQDAYYDLIEDAEFQDANLVGEQTATKLKGKIGAVYGSNVVVCDEFAPKAVNAFCALAVNTRNFIMPRLRGITVESEYQTVEQRRALVATQRIGFDDIITGAASKWGLQYAAA